MPLVKVYQITEKKKKRYWKVQVKNDCLGLEAPQVSHFKHTLQTTYPGAELREQWRELCK